MDKPKIIGVLLWAKVESVESEKTGFIIKIEGSRYSIMARRRHTEDVDSYSGVKAIEVDLELINRLETYFSSHGTAIMSAELLNLVREVLQKEDVA